jgi:hypothetical protein
MKTLLAIVAAVYGNTVEVGSVANTALGGGRLYDNRIMFPRSGNIVSVKKYWIGNLDGYGAGTGGSVKYELRTDDGSARHLPTATVLGQSAPTSGASAAGGETFNAVNFTAPITVQANTWYHLVAYNTDASPNTNYISMDDIWDGNGVDSTTFPPYTNPAGTVRNPVIPDEQFAVLYKDGSSPWTNRDGYTAVQDFAYSNGSHFGMGYMDSSSTTAGGGTGHLASGANKVGEIFTVSGSDKVVSSLSVAVVRVSGSSPLTATLLSGKSTITTATNIGLVPQGSSAVEGYNQRFATFNFPATIKAGVTYQLEFSAPSDTVYNIEGAQDGAAAGYGFAPATVFSDGWANYNTGSGWTVGWDTWGASPPNDKSQDLAFYFTLN